MHEQHSGDQVDHGVPGDDGMSVCVNHIVMCQACTKGSWMPMYKSVRAPHPPCAWHVCWVA
jgi:hypothetical protein